MDDAEAFAVAVVAWVNAMLPRLGPDQRAVFDAMLAGRCDIAIEARLRQGTIKLVAIDEVQGRRSVLYRQDVHPLRDDTDFGSPDTSRNQ